MPQRTYDTRFNLDDTRPQAQAARMRILLPLLCGFFIGSAVSDAEQPAPIAAALTGPVTAGKGQPFGALTAKDLAARSISG